MSTVNNSDVFQLTAMGFSDSDAREALRITSGNMELAVNHLLSDVGGASSSAATTSTVAETTSVDLTTVIQGTTSQYTFSNVGRSACTCIALTAASMFLSKFDGSSSGDVQDVLSPEFLDRMITQGIETYQQILTTSSNSTAVEHMSAEEVLQQQPNVHLQIAAGGVRQGVLTHDRDYPLGLKALVEGILMESRESNEWICLLMTKTPETILICLPPPSLATESSFWLIDSHPRTQFGNTIESAYACPHPSLQALLESLYAIFPTTDLGPDIPEMMAEMYNSFDLYPLQRQYPTN
ncbi:ubiquitin-associated UBA domain protein [Nitzschia inconspicua]|uniref:Ubiquitin-associated UBA domain protein n=1 Tax=Nitzschia inconspicua TaxID=303405 RepID=A0A9K3LBG9_9STRA|nr:ubiquitin-associated UBA domain protein [Nitzschia inconspicua]